ncbi:MAG: hypothetical protein IPK13_03670 [Deltaproteobacteria bacterium]|nr:hypothetical protein [Deltaproteobacteria bacterium]
MGCRSWAFGYVLCAVSCAPPALDGEAARVDDLEAEAVSNAGADGGRGGSGVADGSGESGSSAAAEVKFGRWDPLPTADSFEGLRSLLASDEKTELAIDEEALSASSAYAAGLLDDAFKMGHLDALRAHPWNADLLVSSAAFDPDGAHAVSSLIRRAAELQGTPINLEPLSADNAFDAAMSELCAEARCEEPVGALPPDLEAALGPVLLSIAEGLKARRARDAAQTDGGRGAEWWWRYGGSGVIFDPSGQTYDPNYAPDRAYLTDDRSQLYGAAAQIAHAIESISWREFAGRKGVRFDLATEAGAIRVRDAADDVYDASEPTLLLIDLGGNDRHLDDVASNLSGANAVSIVVDVAGDDRYERDETEDRYSQDGVCDGMAVSTSFRQGAARNGVAMLFDLSGNDLYDSLRGSQGYAHQGVGVLFDREGDDHYRAEATSQGAAQFGIGLLVDLEGRDAYSSVYTSQGFGFVGGVGIAHDAAGNDEWRCDEGRHDAIYLSPQLPGRANTSLCQGAGFGFRSDDRARAMSGGLGVLRDRSGDDTYSAGVYAQGVGYWQGTGILSDGEGRDQYDALYYAQGVGVHYAAGILVDEKGDDVHGKSLASEGYSIAAALDYSVGVLFDLQGDDEHRFGAHSVGAASVNAVALYVDGAGSDRYIGRRPGQADRGARSRMLDVDGCDEYLEQADEDDCGDQDRVDDGGR